MEVGSLLAACCLQLLSQIVQPLHLTTLPGTWILSGTGHKKPWMCKSGLDASDRRLFNSFSNRLFSACALAVHTNASAKTLFPGSSHDKHNRTVKNLEPQTKQATAVSLAACPPVPARGFLWTVRCHERRVLRQPAETVGSWASLAIPSCLCIAIVPESLSSSAPALRSRCHPQCLWHPLVLLQLAALPHL